jgi:hypothetical protein
VYLSGYGDKLLLTTCTASGYPKTQNVSEQLISTLANNFNPTILFSLSGTSTMDYVGRGIFIADTQSVYYMDGIWSINDFISSIYYKRKAFKYTYKLNPPTNLTLTVNGQNHPVISWTDNSTDETDFTVERRLSSQTAWTRIGRIDTLNSGGVSPASQTLYSFIDDGGQVEFPDNVGINTLVDTNVYYYRVKSRKVV